MTITDLRILPPLAIGRLGGSPKPMAAYSLQEVDGHPLDFRRIVPEPTFVVDDETGEITREYTPSTIKFRDDDLIRPVAPFLEVFAVVDERLVPLTLELLEDEGLSVGDLAWQVEVANRKVERRTGDEGDRVAAETGWFSDHTAHPLLGTCDHFYDGAAVPFGTVRFVKPSDDHPEIRLRFTPATGEIYGPRHDQEGLIDEAHAVYDPDKGEWVGFEIPVDDDGNEIVVQGRRFYDETFPPSLFAIEPPAPPWLHDNKAKSRGYLDDACDGIVQVRLRTPDGELVASARITSGPPALAPDAGFVRTLLDDLEQVVHGPEVSPTENEAVTRARAEDIVRRAFETVRFMNVAVMNGEDVDGRPALSLDTMPAEEAFDTARLMRPVMSNGSVDTFTVMGLHQQVFAALRAGAAPWFAHLLRRPDEVGDFTDQGRRKMPALMCGADGSYLALTWRQIDTIERVASQAPFVAADAEPSPTPKLTPKNRTAHLRHRATGNPFSTLPATAVGNCTPGLEVDFRAVWRRVFEGITLREWDNLVVEADDPALVHHRLLRVNGVDTMTPMVGPSPADPTVGVVLTSESNPTGLGPLEWSNALAHVLHTHQGEKVTCEFSKEAAPDRQVSYDEGVLRARKLRVRHVFDEGTAMIARALAEPGELTQGLCSPWQNDFRECSCYYWASARPDFVNVVPGEDGAAAGDNWLQKERTGSYVPDDYVDTRLVLYDDLLGDWQRWLRFQVGGRDAPGEDARR
jgi:hypothetical protein